MIYSIPDTTQEAIVSCEVRDDNLLIATEQKTESCALSTLTTQKLVDDYGAALALERFTQSYGDRSYNWINWQVMPIFMITLGLPLTLLLSGEVVGALVSASVLLSIQFLVHAIAGESVYRNEDSGLAKNIDVGLLNLRRIQALDIENIDSIGLDHTMRRMQGIVNNTLQARRTDPTTGQSIATGIALGILDAATRPSNSRRY